MTEQPPNWTSEWVRLEQPRLGTRVVYATDDFFADKARLIDPHEPVFVPDKYDDHGKWMDGWESRRRRQPGHDHCIVRLGVPGALRGVEIDTRHFTGNYPPQASIDVAHSEAEIPADGEWQTYLDMIELSGDSRHFVQRDSDTVVTHVRLNIWPDGGVARLRLFGEVKPNADNLRARKIDLLAVENGGRALLCNDQHFGSMHNLNLNGRGVNMGDGWETARRRGPGNDWVILALGCLGTVEEVLIDTKHFKGNYPDRAMLQAVSLPTPVAVSELNAASDAWPVLLPEQKLAADSEHRFCTELLHHEPVTHVKLSIFPDGGVSRLRLHGSAA